MYIMQAIYLNNELSQVGFGCLHLFKKISYHLAGECPELKIFLHSYQIILAAKAEWATCSWRYLPVERGSSVLQLFILRF